MYEIIKVRVSGKNKTKPHRLVSKPGSINSTAANKINIPLQVGTVGVSPQSNCRLNSIQQRTPVRWARNAPSKPPKNILNNVKNEPQK